MAGSCVSTTDHMLAAAEPRLDMLGAKIPPLRCMALCATVPGCGGYWFSRAQLMRATLLPMPLPTTCRRRGRTKRGRGEGGGLSQPSRSAVRARAGPGLLLRHAGAVGREVDGQLL